MDKSAKLQLTSKLMIVLSAHIGMDSSVPVMLMYAHKEPNGLEVIVKQLKRNVKLACIGVETGVQSYHHNVLTNLCGTIYSTDVFLSIISVLVGLIILDNFVYLTVNVKTIKFGVIP